MFRGFTPLQSCTVFQNYKLNKTEKTSKNVECKHVFMFCRMYFITKAQQAEKSVSTKPRISLKETTYLSNTSVQVFKAETVQNVVC
jgi:hypothetical protein